MGEGESRKKIPESTCERDLGVLMPSNGKFNQHWSERCRKAYVQIAMAKKSTALRTVPFWRRIWESYISPVLLYGSPVAYQNVASINDMLMKVWRDFWAYVGGPPQGMMNPVQRILYLDLRMTKRWSLNQIRIPIGDVFKLPEDQRTKSYKNCCFLIPKRERFSGRAEFGARNSIAWNSLGAKLRKSKMPAFCKGVKELILTNKIAIRIPRERCL